MLSSLTNRVIGYTLIGVLFTIPYLAHALPFSVTPAAGTNLPTQLLAGKSANAFYTVTNNTSSLRVNNFVRYLPPNVTQVTSNSSIPNLCAATFTLQPHNSTGSSCTLELLIAGGVDGNDQTPEHNLFVCFPGSTSCAGTPSPLNVSLIPIANAFVAGGIYVYNRYSTAIALATSTNNGGSWTQQALAAPTGYRNGAVNGISCTGNTCAAVGSYEYASYSYNPLIAISTNQGSSWTQHILDAPAGYYYGMLSGVNCLGDACVAVGQYTLIATAENQSAIVSTTNGGLAWTQQVLPLPSGIINSLLNGVNCAGSTCVAVGGYTNSNNDEVPGIAVSNNGGQTWVQQTLPLLTNYYQNILNGVACSGSACIAVGSYQDNNSVNHLGVAISTDNGVSWSQQILTPPGPFISGNLNGISCTSNYCVAVGNYGDGSEYGIYPAIAVTSNNGATWSQQSLPMVSGYTFGTLQGVTCTTTTCVATGYYFTTTNDNDPFPFIAVSTNSGNTWSQQVLTPPPAYQYGMFNAIG